MKYWTLIMAFFVLTVSLAETAETGPAKPGKQDKCPVCGMFVAHYPDFMAQVVFKDGTHAWFCGVKDMMKYYFEPSKYDPSKKTADIAAIIVTDYSNLKPKRKLMKALCLCFAWTLLSVAIIPPGICASPPVLMQDPLWSQ